jgi:hypothetical protein
MENNEIALQIFLKLLDKITIEKIDLDGAREMAQIYKVILSELQAPKK